MDKEIIERIKEEAVGIVVLYASIYEQISLLEKKDEGSNRKDRLSEALTCAAISGGSYGGK